MVWAARVSTAGEASIEARDQDPERNAGLIRYLMRDRHGTPFEHNSMTFLISAPIFVFREFMRHRVGWSYNEESARYRQLEPVFYVPGSDRKLVQEGKPGHYVFVDGTPEQHKIVVEATEEACRQAYGAYLEMLEAGIAREVARGVLPVGTYSSMYATCNARSLMHFLALRTKREDSTLPVVPAARDRDGRRGHGGALRRADADRARRLRSQRPSCAIAARDIVAGMNAPFGRVLTAMVTPFTADGGLDLDGAQRSRPTWSTRATTAWSSAGRPASRRPPATTRRTRCCGR